MDTDHPIIRVWNDAVKSPRTGEMLQRIVRMRMGALKRHIHLAMRGYTDQARKEIKDITAF